MLYRPSCADCTACLSARIRVKDFTPSRTQRRVLAKNSGFKRTATSPWATEEQFNLFRTYLDSRHADGGMADMDIFEFAAMIEETPIKSRVVEYRGPRLENTTSETAPKSRPLSAVCLTDVLDDGVSMVYSFYDPAMQDRSLGTYLILDHIEIARRAGLPYVYLGYWVPGSRKMGYKAKFAALEIFKGGQWVDLGNPEDHAQEAHPLAIDPIAEQVARITLPDTRQI